jgi:hypothetical protein
VQEQQFNEELERRLQIIEEPDYEDPARKDLPYVDLVILAAIIFVTVVAMYWWGY